MKTTGKVLIMLALIVAVFSQSSSVSAADVYKFKGYSAAAFFSETDPSGCIVTGGSVFVLRISVIARPDRAAILQMCSSISSNRISVRTRP